MNSCLYDFVMIPADWFGLRAWRKWAASLKAKKVLEIGAGTGLNLAYYNNESKVFALDPDAGMLKRAVARAHGIRREAYFCFGRAEALPFRSAAFDAALATLVFCTVNDLPHSLGELNRVLKPQAPVRLFEHVRLRSGTGARIQDVLTPAWKRIAGGCHLNRDTLKAVETAGFEIRRVQEQFGGVFIAVDALKIGESTEECSPGANKHPATACNFCGR